MNHKSALDAMKLTGPEPRHFLKEHENHITIQKLRRNEPLTAQDLEELEKVFVDAGVAERENLEKVKADGGLGVFIRSLVGLDREAAKHVFDGFQADRTLAANQIEFLNLVIDYLTERGVMEPRLLYENPFTDLDALGVEGVFDGASVIELISILNDVKNAPQHSPGLAPPPTPLNAFSASSPLASGP